MVPAASEYEQRLQEYEREVTDLQGQLKALEEEVVGLRRRLQDAPKRVRTLEERLLETKGQLAQALSQNEKLSATLREAREHIAALREEVEKLTMPPSGYGTYLDTNEDGSVDVFTAGRKMRVSLHPQIDAAELQKGQEVVLNESFNVVLAREIDLNGEVVTLKEVLEDGKRALIVGRADEERVVEMADALIGEKLRAGDTLLMEGRSGLLVEKLLRPEVQELILEEVPDVTYDDVGGLDDQIEMIMDAVELPYLYGDLFTEHELPPPKGILLYGPPGCGKTLIAKAVANSLAKRVAEKTGNRNIRSFFLNIKGPELLNKYVGETERQIRLIFQRAREKADEGVPVIIFFDEMESLFRTRGSGISSDIESTIVPQLLVGDRRRREPEERHRDRRLQPGGPDRPGHPPARPARREDQDRAARRGRRKRDLLPLPDRRTCPLAEADLAKAKGDREKAVQTMIKAGVDYMYRADDDNRFLEVTYQNGDKEILYFKDFSSGAMIENIVRRAKKLSIKRLIAGGDKGITAQDLIDSIRQEFKEHEDLPNTTNPDDWAKISGKKGERIVYIRTLIASGKEAEGGRSIERVATGQYL